MSRNCENVYFPTYPIAGEKVATELENLDDKEYPNLWEWIGRINKLKQELDISTIT